MGRVSHLSRFSLLFLIVVILFIFAYLLGLFIMKKMTFPMCSGYSLTLIFHDSQVSLTIKKSQYLQIYIAFANN